MTATYVLDISKYLYGVTVRASIEHSSWLAQYDNVLDIHGFKGVYTPIANTVYKRPQITPEPDSFYTIMHVRRVISLVMNSDLTMVAVSTKGKSGASNGMRNYACMVLDRKDPLIQKALINPHKGSTRYTGNMLQAMHSTLPRYAALSICGGTCLVLTSGESMEDVVNKQSEIADRIFQLCVSSIPLPLPCLCTSKLYTESAYILSLHTLYCVAKFAEGHLNAIEDMTSYLACLPKYEKLIDNIEGLITAAPNGMAQQLTLFHLISMFADEEFAIKAVCLTYMLVNMDKAVLKENFSLEETTNYGTLVQSVPIDMCSKCEYHLFTCDVLRTLINICSAIKHTGYLPSVLTIAQKLSFACRQGHLRINSKWPELTYCNVQIMPTAVEGLSIEQTISGMVTGTINERTHLDAVFDWDEIIKGVKVDNIQHDEPSLFSPYVNRIVWRTGNFMGHQESSNVLMHEYEIESQMMPLSSHLNMLSGLYPNVYEVVANCYRSITGPVLEQDNKLIVINCRLEFTSLLNGTVTVNSKTFKVDDTPAEVIRDSSLCLAMDLIKSGQVTVEVTEVPEAITFFVADESYVMSISGRSEETRREMTTMLAE
jgi:hypothetical protein